MKLSYIPLRALSFALLAPAFLHAQTANSVSRPNLRTPMEVTSRSAQLVGPYDQTQKLRVVFALKSPKQDEEDKFLEALYTPGSPEYHKFLTAKEWNDRFSPSAADEQAVADWATQQGLTVTKRYPNRLIVDVEAPVATIQKALSVNVNRYQVNGAMTFSNDRDPVIPSHLSGIISGVLGLNNIQVLHPHSKLSKNVTHPDYVAGPVAALAEEHHIDGSLPRLQEALAAKTKNNNGPAPSFTAAGYLAPTDLYGSNAYNFTGLYRLSHCCNPNQVASGSPPATSIAIATAGVQKFTDIQGFQKQFPYLAVNITYVDIDGTPTTPDGEGTLDAEWATAMSNSFGSFRDTAHVYVYQGVNAHLSTFIDIYNQMLTDNRARTMSVSWGCPEAIGCGDVEDATNAVLSAMAGQGWTLIADADDKGSVADCAHVSVEFPASSPNVIAAGGTLLSLNTDSTYFDEDAWSGDITPGSCASNNGGGGGGFSSKYSVPFYQAFLGHGVRTLPDISLNAEFPQAIFVNGALIGAGGTSIVAPELAGFFAQENSYLTYLQSQGVRCFSDLPCVPIGNANAYIYSEQQHNDAPHYPFYDITTGCVANDVTLDDRNLTFFCASPGYDFATGLGSANMMQLAWAINYAAAGDFGAPGVQFSGPAVNSWHNTDQQVSMTFTDTAATGHQANGVAGFSVAWDIDPAPESFSKSTPGSNDAFYSGPEFPNQNHGVLNLSIAGQGCHTAKAKAWDNAGTSSGVLSYGPVCYDTFPPVSRAALSGTLAGGLYTTPVRVTLAATDSGSGAGGSFYRVDNGLFIGYNGPITVSAPGSHVVTYFSKDVAGNEETARSTSFTIKAIPTATQIASSLNPSTYGNKVTLTAKVTIPSGGLPQGTVAFKEGSTTLGTAALTNGQAALAILSLTAGSHPITAVYNGANNDAPSTSAPLNQTVSKAATKTALVSSANPVVHAINIALTATVTPASGTSVTGNITFKDGTAILGTASVDPSTHKATVFTSTLAVGTHSITASYTGSSNFNVSVSPTLQQIVK